MKNIIAACVIAISIVASPIVVFRYAPLKWFETESSRVGATITTIQGTDTLSNSRSTINTNFANLNSSKAEITDVAGTTTLRNLSSVGTITTGVWNGTPITAANGGTGSTTLSSNQVLLGNGTGIVKVVSGFGSSGQSLVSNGNGTAPSWQSVSFDTSLAYTNTGLWTFNTGGIIAAASSTINAAFDIAARSGAALKLNALSYVFPSSRGANETVLTENGSGALSFNDVTTIGAGAMLSASTTDLNVNDTLVETTYGTTTIPANLLGTTGALRIKVFATTYNDNGNNNRVAIRVKLGSTTVCSAALSSGSSNYGVTEYEMTLAASSSAALQQCQGLATSATGESYTENSSSVDTTSAQVLTITAQWDGNDGGDVESFTIGGSNITFLGR